MSDIEKQRAAYYAAEQVNNGMLVGLGTGSTAAWMVRRLGERLAENSLKGITGICTSTATEKLATEVGIPIRPLDGTSLMDLYIDGADEVNPQGALVKGGGGALLREKMVACRAKKRIIIVDSAKLVDLMGRAFPLPVEIVRFGHESVIEQLKALRCEPILRKTKSGETYLTDEQHYIADCRFPAGIPNPAAMADTIDRIVGVVESGLFINLCDVLVKGTQAGVDLQEFRH